MCECVCVCAWCGWYKETTHLKVISCRVILRLRFSQTSDGLAAVTCNWSGSIAVGAVAVAFETFAHSPYHYINQKPFCLQLSDHMCGSLMCVLMSMFTKKLVCNRILIVQISSVSVHSPSWFWKLSFKLPAGSLAKQFHGNWLPHGNDN